MSTGIIAARYGRALLKLVTGTGRGRQVYDQVQALMDNPQTPPEPLEDDLVKFIALLSSNGRLDEVRYIFNSFLRQYREANGIRKIHLKTVVPSPELEDRIRDVFAGEGSELILSTEVDSDLIGGFVLQVDDRVLDASVSRQLEIIRNQLIEKTNRIV
ncbi:MAG: F0F1 ATP synthase subunit delta [Bacteroidales bacterium]|nr:F0F1 ATP synthase subunit delta [Bacteroidales bacterium]